MENEIAEEAREFWSRVDVMRGSRTVKNIAETIGIEYELIRVQRTRHRTPRLTIAVAIAKELGTTVEYLASGENGHHQLFIHRLYTAYKNADDIHKSIVDITLNLRDDTAKRHIMA
jgi:hypothetical protein